jgi:hypothetical protein
VQLLPFMEESTVYDKLAQNVGTARLGKLQDAAFPTTPANAPTQNPGTAPSATNPVIWATKLGGMVCPSHPGEEDVAKFGNIPGYTPEQKVATGNYMALAASHYRSQPAGHLESAGNPSSAGSPGGGKDCASGAYCGNGALVFPGVVNGKVQKTGLGMQAMQADGTSKTAMICESREEVLTSWYSGLASYVVGHWPNTANTNYPGGPSPFPTTGVAYWVCPNATCDTALNKGDPKVTTTSKYYMNTNPHGNFRNWGPSSRHPGVVIHGYADSHSEGINETIDKDVYFHIITRSGREVDNPQ